MIVLLALSSTETRLNTYNLARVNTVEGDLVEEHLVIVLLALPSTETRLNTHSLARVNAVEGDLVEDPLVMVLLALPSTETRLNTYSLSRPGSTQWRGAWYVVICIHIFDFPDKTWLLCDNFIFRHGNELVKARFFYQ